MYKIKFSENAAKCFRKLDSVSKKKIVNYFDRKSLLENPKSFGKALRYKLRENWRYRIGDYRVICRIEQEELIILVLDIGHRKNIY